jgi:transcriptional regulator with XRE-family HTH domain
MVPEDLRRIRFSLDDECLRQRRSCFLHSSIPAFGMFLRRRDTSPIPERNRQILQMRSEGLKQAEVARQFGLSPSRIWLIERRDGAHLSLAQRRAKLREKIRAADDPEKLWPVEDLVDAVGMIVVTRKRLLDHFVTAGKRQISLQELMDMRLDAPMEGLDSMVSPLLRVYGVGK